MLRTIRPTFLTARRIKQREELYSFLADWWSHKSSSKEGNHLFDPIQLNDLIGSLRFVVPCSGS